MLPIFIFPASLFLLLFIISITSSLLLYLEVLPVRNKYLSYLISLLTLTSRSNYSLIIKMLSLATASFISWIFSSFYVLFMGNQYFILKVFAVCLIGFFLMRALYQLCLPVITKIFYNSTPEGDNLIGRECIVRSTKVTDNFGEAFIYLSPQTSEKINIISSPQNNIKEGDKVFIINYIKNRNEYYVEKL